MKNLKFITVICLLLTVFACKAQENETTAIKKVIVAFAKAGDENNTSELDRYLDENYRIVMNRAFGSEKVSIMPKAVFLKKIESKEYGGDNRTVTVENITMNGITASAKVSFKGEKMSFTSLVTLIQDKNNKWKIISDTPAF